MNARPGENWGTPLYFLYRDDLLNRVFFELLVINRVYNSNPFPIFLKFAIILRLFTQFTLL